MQNVYETERLILTQSDVSIAGRVAEYFLRNKEFFRETEPTRDEEFFIEDYQREQMCNHMIGYENGTSVCFWFSEKNHPDQIIGSVGISNIVMGAFLSCFLSYRGDATHLRKGYVTEAVGQLIRIAFDEIGLHRIEANIMPKNGASLAVAKKLGFQNEGISRSYLRINGIWEDHIHMVLLNTQMQDQ